MKRRDFIKLGALTGGGALLTSLGVRPEKVFGQGLFSPSSIAAIGDESFPTSPLILSPFSDPLPIPEPLAPSNPATWGIPPDPKKHQLWMKPKAFYRIPLRVAGHSFTSSPVKLADGTTMNLPPSTIYGFNGTFPGPMIRAFYGRPVMVRFENHLDENPDDLDRGDFGKEMFLTHLHNGHTAPESDGNPHHRHHAYMPGEHMDCLYLNWPAGGDDREKQSFMWFHDHTHGDTSTNVYKGMVGLYPIYDAMDCGDETKGFRLPGFEYDIPLAVYDCLFDDGVSPHNGMGQDGLPHPENLGKLFFAQYPNHGFVGDVFTVNGKVQPYLAVKRRKYRLRFLDASIARWYQFKLMSGSLQVAPGVQGQYVLAGGQQVMRFTQIASEGGLLPAPLVRDSFTIAPAKRREFIVDFSQYLDGSPTQPGDEIYLTNVLEMTDGRKPDGVQSPGVPVLKFIIEGDPSTPDLSIIPPVLRPIPPLPPPSELAGLRHRRFELHRSGDEWLINDEPFDPMRSIADPVMGSAELWTFENGGGGWVHPMHIHQEEHRVVSRDGSPPPAEDISKEDVVALGEGEEVTIYRKFRDFTGKYVAHCHNLAHEDHSMMFSWTIVPPP